ncbi:MAG: hypothetical protein ACE5EO_08370 [Candidatus Krumholzibacteriia bacterium]
MRTKTICIVAVSILAAAGCMKIKQLRTGGAGPSACRLVMVFGGGPSRPHRDARPGEKYWMAVYFEVSDSTYEFGHLDPDGDFQAYAIGERSLFEVRGGTIRDFALRELAPEMTVYPLDEFGTCGFAGPEMRPSMAIFPPRESPYYSIATLSFFTPADTVTVEITTSSPNGFGRADS